MRDSDKLILEEVSTERIRQEVKWGTQNHCPADWLMILGEEIGEANKAALEAKFEKKYHYYDTPKTRKYSELRQELIQISAVAVAFIQSLDRNELCQKPVAIEKQK